MSKKFAEMKKITSANIIKCGQYRLDANVLTYVTDKENKAKAEERAKMIKKRDAYLKLCDAADKVKIKPRDLWTKNDYQVMLKPCKDCRDGKMPDDMDALKQAWEVWSYRPRRVFVIPDEVITLEHTNDDAVDSERDDDDDDDMNEEEV